jgi:uncharacterized phage protein gp47/JayE
MAYFTPYIDDTGFHIPTYIDVRDQLITDAKSIYGQDIYLGIDSQDYQWISTVSEKIYDAYQLAQLVYNNRGPSTSIGSGLDSVVKINGIKRKPATYSTCYVSLTGLPNAQINNGIALDKGNIKWDLPPSVKLNDSGTLDNVLVTCEISGPIVANPGDIAGIFNPMYGWNGVYNNVNAELGSNVEGDSDLRTRQSNSTANPSKTVLDGTKGAIGQITAVTRFKVYENDTKVADVNGLPANSITCVVEGGTDADIANAIYMHKGPGCLANGDIVINEEDQYNSITPIGFTRPTYVDIETVVNIKQIKDYTTATTDLIKENIQAYLNSMEIGGDLTISSLWGIALQAMPNLASPMFSVVSVTAARLGNAQAAVDIPMAYNEVCRGNINYITVNVS